MEHTDVRLRNVVEELAQIIRRDGGSLDFEAYDSTTGELTVLFRKASDNGCITCVIDETNVRLFLEEAVRAQAINMASLRIKDA